VHADLAVLLERILAIAHERLRKQGHFYPFGLVATSDGTTQEVSTDDGTQRELPWPEEAIVLLTQQLQREVTTRCLEAVATCIDTTSLPSPNGEPASWRAALAGRGRIRVFLEHGSGIAVEIEQPYRLRLFRAPQYGDLVSSPAASQIFTRGR
jgi:hypothetical protein